MMEGSRPLPFKRRTDLDYVKGISILLMIVMHSGNLQNYKFAICVSAFFMPVFYVVCGQLAAIKNPNGLGIKQLKIYCLKRFRQILVPYFVFGGALILFFQFLHLLAGEPLTIKIQLFRLVTMQGIESMWFLTRYLAAEFMLLFILLKLPKLFRFGISLLSIILIAVISNTGMPANWLLRILIGAHIGLVFAYLGYVIEKYHIVQKLHIWEIVLLFVVCIIGSLYNGFIGVGALQLQNVSLFFFDAIGLSIVLGYVCTWLASQKREWELLKLFGQNTIVIVCTNNLVLEIMRLIDYKITGNFLLHAGLFGAFLFAAILAGVEYIIILLSKKKCSVLFGR